MKPCRNRGIQRQLRHLVRAAAFWITYWECQWACLVVKSRSCHKYTHEREGSIFTPSSSQHHTETRLLTSTLPPLRSFRFVLSGYWTPCSTCPTNTAACLYTTMRKLCKAIHCVLSVLSSPLPHWGNLWHSKERRTHAVDKISKGFLDPPECTKHNWSTRSERYLALSWRILNRSARSEAVKIAWPSSFVVQACAIKCRSFYHVPLTHKISSYCQRSFVLCHF